MQITKKKNKKQYIVAALVIATTLGIGVFFLYQYTSDTKLNTETSDITSDPSKPISTKSDQDQAETLKNNPDNKNISPNTDTAAPSTVDKSSGKTIVQMIASADLQDNQLYIRGGVNSVVPEDGSCYVQLKGPSGQLVRKNTTVLQNSSSTDCKTITIPTTELVPGKWTYVLHYTSINYKGSSSEATVSI